ncbi:MAG: M13 family metallopeptidase [Nevskiaceae bacterium]
MTLLTGASRAILMCALVVLAGCAGAPPAPPLGSGVELANIDRSVRPQDDFYRHVNGAWLKDTEIPADRSNYGTFTKLAEKAEQDLRAIIEESAAAQAAPGTDPRKVGDFFASFMDEARLEQLGVAPLQDELDRIAAIKSRGQLPAAMARLDGIGAGIPVGLFIGQDAKEPSRYIATLFQSGLGLPDRDYYLLPDAKFKDMRAAYVKHVERTLALAGDKGARANARAILALETALAKKYWTRVDSRDDDKTYNKKTRTELKALAPAFGWDAFLDGVGIKEDTVIVAQPSAFAGFSGQLAAQPLGTWRAYLRWHLLRTYSPYLSQAFVDENFGFYGKTLRGIEENRPRWKRGVSAVQGGLEGDAPFASKGLGEVLGRIYVARHFPPQAKARMEDMVRNLLAAYRNSIEKLDWMGPETRARALEKLSKFTTKIGYPDRWRDYAALEVRADDLVGNLMRGARFDNALQVAKLGKPVDRSEWFMTPQIVNAYYNSTMNEIVFPAAILQPPFFNLAADDAVNYGGIGAVIGHEIGHGFDDQGSKSDGDGRLQSWWTEGDRKAFEGRAQQLIDQYAAYEPLPGHKINGALTIGENIGDLGGASIAYQAYQLSLEGRPAPVLDGFTGDQRFFVGYAQIWARKYREQALLERLKTDSHSPAEYRCNAIVPHVPEFYAAFDVKPGDGMYMAPERRVKIW